MNSLASSAVDRGLSGPQNDERHTEERFQRLRAKIEKYWLFRPTATGSTARSIARGFRGEDVGQSGLSSLLSLSKRRIAILRQSGRMPHRPQRMASMNPCTTSSPDSGPRAARLFHSSIANAQDRTARKTPIIKEERDGKSPPWERDSRLRKREIPAAAAGAGLSHSRIHVKSRTELHVVAPAAEIPEEGLSSRRLSARIAIFHRGVIRGAAGRLVVRAATRRQRGLRRVAIGGSQTRTALLSASPQPLESSAFAVLSSERRAPET